MFAGVGADYVVRRPVHYQIQADSLVGPVEKLAPQFEVEFGLFSEPSAAVPFCFLLGGSDPVEEMVAFREREAGVKQAAN